MPPPQTSLNSIKPIISVFSQRVFFLDPHSSLLLFPTLSPGSLLLGVVPKTVHSISTETLLLPSRMEELFHVSLFMHMVLDYFTVLQ